MVMSEHIVTTLVKKDILVHTAQWNVPQTVDPTPAEIRTECVLVLQVGRVITVLKHVLSPMGNTVGTLAICNVIMIHVTDLMEDVSLVVKMAFMVNCVIKKNYHKQS